MYKFNKSIHPISLSEFQFFFNTKYLIQYHTAGESKKNLVPGHCYFKKVEEFMNSHYEEGDNYREFLKCPNDQCSSCKPWVGPTMTKCPRPYPDWSALPHYSYMPYSKTPLQGRNVDDWQPRMQLVKWFDEKKINTSDPESVSTFSDKLIVKPKLVLDYLHHIEVKAFRKEKREQEKATEKQKANNKAFGDYQWQQLVQNINELKKLRVSELDKYLHHHNLGDHLKKRKGEKIILIQNHFISSHSELEDIADVEEGCADTDEEECEDEYVSDDDEDDGDGDDDEQELNDIVLSVIGDDNDDDEALDEAPPLVSRFGRRIVNRNANDYFYF